MNSKVKNVSNIINSRLNNVLFYRLAEYRVILPKCTVLRRIYIYNTDIQSTEYNPFTIFSKINTASNKPICSILNNNMTIRRLLSKSYSFYRSIIDNAFSPRNLFYTNVLLSIGISTTGDIMEQCYEWQMKDIDTIDTHRTAQMAFSGCTAGIICHHWYNFLDRIIIGRSFDMVIKKLLLDQFICSPIVILSFFATVAIFEDDPLENFNDEIKEKFWTLYKAEWVVWPPAQIINFYFLPTKYRVVYDNTISLGYDIYTSHVKHQKPPKGFDKRDADKQI